VGIALSVVTDDACTKGQSLFLVMRPESITLVPENATPPEGEATAAGIVRSRTFLGEKVEYTVEVAGTSLHAVTYDPARRGVAEVGSPCASAATRRPSDRSRPSQGADHANFGNFFGALVVAVLLAGPGPAAAQGCPPPRALVDTVLGMKYCTEPGVRGPWTPSRSGSAGGAAARQAGRLVIYMSTPISPRGGRGGEGERGDRRGGEGAPREGLTAAARGSSIPARIRCRASEPSRPAGATTW